MSAKWLALCGWLAAAGASAHALSEATARLTLRDDHFDVALDVDLFLLVPEGPTAVATAGDAEVAERLASLRRQFESGTKLQVDGVQVPLRFKDGLTPAEFRAVAAMLSASGREHGERFRLGLDATATTPGAREVVLGLPEGLGPVVATFVEPAMSYVQPRGEARFRVRGRPSEEEKEQSESEDMGTEALVLGLGGTAVLAVIIRKRLRGGA